MQFVQFIHIHSAYSINSILFTSFDSSNLLSATHPISFPFTFNDYCIQVSQLLSYYMVHSLINTSHLLTHSFMYLSHSSHPTTYSLCRSLKLIITVSQ